MCVNERVINITPQNIALEHKYKLKYLYMVTGRVPLLEFWNNNRTAVCVLTKDSISFNQCDDEHYEI
jgi:hypothetical protein